MVGGRIQSEGDNQDWKIMPGMIGFRSVPGCDGNRGDGDAIIIHNSIRRPSGSHSHTLHAAHGDIAPPLSLSLSLSLSLQKIYLTLRSAAEERRRRNDSKAEPIEAHLINRKRQPQPQQQQPRRRLNHGDDDDD